MVVYVLQFCISRKHCIVTYNIINENMASYYLVSRERFVKKITDI